MVRVREQGNGYKIGDKIGRFEILGWQFRIRYEWHFVGRCSCGRIKAVRLGHAIAGRIKSCGCFNSEVASARSSQRLTHGQTDKPLYRLWAGMKNRCTSSDPDKYRVYKSRGISVCQEWDASFEAFAKWALDNGYKPGLQIDRFPDNNGNYEPGNCRFVSLQINCRNKRTNHLITAFGETKTATEWAEDSRCMVTLSALLKRIRQGFVPEKAISLRSRKWRLHLSET